MWFIRDWLLNLINDDTTLRKELKADFNFLLYPCTKELTHFQKLFDCIFFNETGLCQKLRNMKKKDIDALLDSTESRHHDKKPAIERFMDDFICNKDHLKTLFYDATANYIRTCWDAEYHSKAYDLFDKLDNTMNDVKNISGDDQTSNRRGDENTSYDPKDDSSMIKLQMKARFEIANMKQNDPETYTPKEIFEAFYYAEEYSLALRHVLGFHEIIDRENNLREMVWNLVWREKERIRTCASSSNKENARRSSSSLSSLSTPPLSKKRNLSEPKCSNVDD